MKDKKKNRTDDDYCRLDDAIATLTDWRKEILDTLAAKAISWRAYDQVLAAMRQVHSPDDAE